MRGKEKMKDLEKIETGYYKLYGYHICKKGRKWRVHPPCSFDRSFTVGTRKEGVEEILSILHREPCAAR